MENALLAARRLQQPGPNASSNATSRRYSGFHIEISNGVLLNDQGRNSFREIIEKSEVGVLVEEISFLKI